MGNNVKKNFSDNYTYNDIVNSISKTQVNKDFDLLVFVDCSKSTKFVNGSSLHNIPNNLNEINQNAITNQYILVMQLFKDFIDVEYETDIYLYFFGTLKASNNSDKLEKINRRLINDGKYETKETQTNLCKTINELIDAYIAGIINVEDDEKNDFSQNDTLIYIFDETIKYVKKKNKYTICLIFIDENLNDKNLYDNLVAVINVSNYPVSIICVCIGDSDFSFLKKLDSIDYKKMNLKKKEIKKIKNKRKFDNFHHVILNSIIKRPLISNQIRKEIFRNIFMETSRQYELVQDKTVLGYIKKSEKKQIIISETKNNISMRYSLDINSILKKMQRKSGETNDKKNRRKTFTDIELLNNINIFDIFVSES